VIYDFTDIESYYAQFHQRQKYITKVVVGRSMAEVGGLSSKQIKFFAKVTLLNAASHDQKEHGTFWNLLGIW
jgi:hypothetical protein